MNTKKSRNSKIVLNLFVAGKTLKSLAALNNLKFICNEVLKGMYKLEVIDILKNPKLARQNQILAIPTLIRNLPLPRKNIIGDLSNRELILAELNLNVKSL
jgi:circadian clock protein KaiB